MMYQPTCEVLNSKFSVYGVITFTLVFQLKNDKPDSEAWIAARFDGHLPKQMRLGDGMLAGGFLNQPLRTDREYRVFVRAYTSDEVFLFAMGFIINTGLVG
jgi:hypothetical protein